MLIEYENVESFKSWTDEQLLFAMAMTCLNWLSPDIENAIKVYRVHWDGFLQLIGAVPPGVVC